MAQHAMPLAPLGRHEPALTIPTAGGCGIGFHRGPLGGCVPNCGRVMVAPAAPIVVAPAAPVRCPGSTCCCCTGSTCCCRCSSCSRCGCARCGHTCGSGSGRSLPAGLRRFQVLAHLSISHVVVRPVARELDHCMRHQLFVRRTPSRLQARLCTGRLALSVKTVEILRRQQFAAE
jgi:hypothetical protein